MLFEPRPGTKATRPDITDKAGRPIVITVGFQVDYDTTVFPNKPDFLPTGVYNCTYIDRDGVERAEKFDAADLSPIDEAEDLPTADEGKGLPVTDEE